MTVKSLDFSPFHPKNIALQDFEEQNKIKKELEVRVREWTEQYCDAIEENYHLGLRLIGKRLGIMHSHMITH